MISLNTAGPGRAILLVRDAHGNQVHSQEVLVRVPDRAMVLAHGLLLIGRSEDEASVAEGRVRIGGTATFLLRWFAGA